MIKFLGGLINLLGQDTDPTETAGMETFSAFIDAVEPYISYLIGVTLVVVGIISVLFALWVAFRLARAEDAGKRREAKKHMIWAIIAAVALVAMFLVLNVLFAPDTGLLVGEVKIVGLEDVEGDETVVSSAVLLLDMISKAISALFRLVGTCAVLFALYLSIRLAMATDEGKRAQAKAQLFWTVLGCIIALALAILIREVMVSIANGLME